MTKKQIRLEGNFPGGQVDLTNRFTLRGDLIVGLEIVPTAVTLSAALGSRLGRIGAWFHPGYGDEVEATLLALDQQVPHAQRGSSLQRRFTHGDISSGCPSPC